MSMKFSRQECLNGLPFPTSEDLPKQGLNLHLLHLLLGRQILSHCATWEAIFFNNSVVFYLICMILNELKLTLFVSFKWAVSKLDNTYVNQHALSFIDFISSRFFIISAWSDHVFLNITLSQFLHLLITSSNLVKYI